MCTILLLYGSLLTAQEAPPGALGGLVADSMSRVETIGTSGPGDSEIILPEEEFDTAVLVPSLASEPASTLLPDTGLAVVESEPLPVVPQRGTPVHKRLGIHDLASKALRAVLHLFRSMLVPLGVLVLVALVVVRFVSIREKKRFLTTTRLSIMDKEVQRACRCIERNCGNRDLDTAWVCQTIVTGESYLEALFQRELGMGVEAFIDQVRINRVKVLLGESPQVTDAELVQKTGLASEFDLMELFDKTVGTSLDSWRQHQTGSRPSA